MKTRRPRHSDPASSRWAALLGAALLAAWTAAPASGQAAGPWWLELGGGGGMLLSGHDHSVEHQLSPAARAALEREIGGGLSVAVEWASTWPSSRFAGGSEKRHHLGVGVSHRPAPTGHVLSVTGGFGLSTVVMQDGPPVPPAFGDVVISIGDTMGPSLVAGAGWGAAVGGLILTPRVGLLLQRIDGHTLSHGLLTLGVGLGG